MSVEKQKTNKSLDTEKGTTKSFVTEEDIIELRKHDIEFSEYETIFLKELKEFLIDTWRPEYHDNLEDLEKKSIKEFNKIILDYPSWGGYYILEDTFTNNQNINLLSEKSKGLIGYFYGIHLR